jgi:hypothetical protein
MLRSPYSKRRVPIALVALALVPFELLACSSGTDQLDCHALLPAAEVHYQDLEALFLKTSGKGCGASNCHGKQFASGGYRFDEPSLVYDALTTRPEIIYGQLASGFMPIGGYRWSDRDLQLFRSWYCNGALPND